MAKGVDDRIVSISFDNAKFEAAVKTTLQSLSSLDAAIRKLGSASGLADISKAAGKVDFKSLSDAIDKINAKLAFPEGAKGLNDIENASNKTQLTGISGALDKVKQKLGFGGDATKGLTDVENASNKITFSTLSGAIDKVRIKLSTLGGGDEFAKIEGASNRVNLEGLNKSIDNVTAHFGAMQAAGLAALATIVSKATTAGGQLVKSLTIEPVSTGLKEYEIQINAIQTILANTQAAGTKLSDVNKALQELNRYADLTIYNFAEMAKNIGTFTAAGVDLETAVGSIKGIANLAALSGSNAQQASTAMYQLSQAISSGRVSLQDWNSVVNAGMGGSVFQRALVNTAVAMGQLNADAVEFTGKMKNARIEGKSFRESIMAKPGEQSWLTKEVLTGTLQQFTGDLTDAELAAEGFSKAQIEAIQKQAKTAVDAATKVKTLSGVIDTAREAAGSGWARTWQIIFGNFTEARETFTSISEGLNGFIEKSAEARNKVLADWKELGGRTELFAGLKAVLEAIGAVLAPIKEAFRDIFPAKTGKDLYDLTVRFREFAESLKIGPETAENLQRTFRGFFAVLHLGKTIIGEILGVFAKLVGVTVQGSGGFLEFTARIGDFLTAVDYAITQGDGLANMFDNIGKVLAFPIKLLQQFANALFSLFGGDISTAGPAESMEQLSDSMKPMAGIIAAISAAWEAFVSVLGQVGQLLAPVFEAFSDFGQKVADAFSNGGFEAVFDVIQTGLIAGIFYTIKKGLADGIGLDLGQKGLFDGLSDTFGILNKNLVAMQNNIKANTLLQIASAVTVLAVGVLMLSLINPDKLASAMTATAVGLGQLVGAMALLTKIGGAGAFLTMPIIAGSLVLLAVAVDVLAIAVAALSQLSWGEIAKGLAAVGGALLAISIGTKLMGPQMIVAAASLIPIAIGLNLMASAMKIFGTMKWEEMGKGIAAIAVGLTVIGIAARFIGPQMLLAGPGLILLAVGLNILSGAIFALGKMNLETLGQGILGAAVAIAALGVATGLIPPTIALQAAGLILLGIALNGIAVAVGLMGNLSVAEIAKGILGLGAALVVLGIGLTAMSGAIPGTIALMGAAVALGALVPVIGILGNMKWATLGKGLLAIAAIMATLAVVGALAAPAMALVGLALVILGAGVAAVGAGVYLIAKGLSILGAEGQKGIAMMVTALTAFVALIPRIVIDFVKGLVAIVDGIVALAPEIAGAFSKILIIILETITKAAPMAGEAMIALITMMLTVINSQAGPIIQAGWNLFQKLLQGFSQHAGELAQVGATAVVNFLNGLSSKAGDIVTAGGNLVISVMQGIVNQQSRMVTAGVQMIGNFLRGVANNLGKVVSTAVDVGVKFVSAVARSASKMVSTGADFIVKMISGIGSAAGRLVAAGVSAATRFVRAIASGLVKMVDEGEKAIIDFMNGVANAIRANQGELNAAGRNLASAIVEGFISFMASSAGALAESLLSPIRAAVDKAKSLLKIKSPSKVFEEIGKNIMLGAQLGIQRNSAGVIAGVADVSTSLIGIGYNMVDNVAAGIASNKNADAEAIKVGKRLLKSWKSIIRLQNSDPKAMGELGAFIGKEFAKGLRGSEDDIVNAYDNLKEKLTSTIEGARQIITSEQAKLRDLLDDKELNLKAIAKAQAVINQNQILISKANAARKALAKQLQDEKQTLITLSDQYDVVTEKLKNAQSALDAAIQQRDNANKSFKDQYTTLPDIDESSKKSLPKYLKDLKARAEAVEKYRLVLDQLRSMGLDNASYQKLLAEGPAAQKFAEQLVAGGPGVIAEINGLDAKIETSASTLATTASTSLYQAGVDTAQGLVNGLTSEQGTIEKKIEETATKITDTITGKLEIFKGSSKQFENIGVFVMEGLKKGLKSERGEVYEQIEAIAKGMIAALKKELHIKSPSRVFEMLGRFTSMGMANGISAGAKAITNAVSGVGDDAVETMRKSIDDISSIVSDQIDANPVITPVLDLTELERSIGKMDSLTKTTPITTAASYSAAASIARSQQATQEASDQPVPAQEIKFEQNNYSPESLSETEIYRLTNNQLSQARRALGLV